MNLKIKKKWIKALRSGEYKQARRSLRVGDNFCCLGVLCDLHAQETGNKWDELYNSYFSNDKGLPDEVIEWAGLKEWDRWAKLPGKDPGNLAAYNDNGWNFAEIADVIEQKF